MWNDFWDDDDSTSDNDSFIYDNYNYVQVWVDGSCLGNGRPGARAGYGVFYNWNHYMNVSAPVKGRATNNTGEIQAATRAIIDCSNYGLNDIVINTDSEFLKISVEERLYHWRRNGFHKTNGEPLANQIDFKRLSSALGNNRHMNIEFQWVRSHAGDEYNEEADRLAKEGARCYQPHWY